MIGKIGGFLTERGHEKVEIKKIIPDVEDCFMALMKE